jgi:hypothetical protein
MPPFHHQPHNATSPFILVAQHLIAYHMNIPLFLMKDCTLKVNFSEVVLFVGNTPSYILVSTAAFFPRKKKKKYSYDSVFM